MEQCRFEFCSYQPAPDFLQRRLLLRVQHVRRWYEIRIPRIFFGHDLLFPAAAIRCAKRPPTRSAGSRASPRASPSALPGFVLQPEFPALRPWPRSTPQFSAGASSAAAPFPGHSDTPAASTSPPPLPRPSAVLLAPRESLARS